MLSPGILCFLSVLLGVAGAQNERATSSVQRHPTAPLSYRKSRHCIFCGKTMDRENPAENITSRATYQNTSTAISHGTNTAVLSVTTGPAASNRHRRKTLGTHVQKEHRMSSLARTVQKVKGNSRPKTRLEVFGTSVVNCTHITCNIYIRNPVRKRTRRSQREVDGQGTGTAQLQQNQAQSQQNQTQPRRIPSRPGYKPKPVQRPPLRPKPNPFQRPPLRPKPNPFQRPPLWYNPEPNSAGSNNYNSAIKPSNKTNDRNSIYWTFSFPVLVPLLTGQLAVRQIS